ncbi:MAG: hypothetical protein C0467_30645 [Planctomycetaceae bacterium]|nr:hypothetical protein [Planctomycetaceae bacterium]
MNPASIALFERLPDKIFSPLGSLNRHGYWSVLCALHRHRFGPDAPMPPSHGYLLRDIHKFIEEHITYDDTWVEEEGEAPADTPLNIRAIGIFNRLLDTGWFRTERYGMERTVSMRPTVSQFLSVLISFAETGPVFVSGKIRSIDANLSLVAKGDAGGDGLREAAEQARHLLEHIRNTGTNVRDLMESLDPNMSTAQYVRGFFRDYIEQVFIGDYRELRTREHPLSRRPQILRSVEHLSTDIAERARLLAWYEQRPAAGDRKKAELMFERDLQRLFELNRIDEYLDRLDDEIRRANRKAIAVLDYHLRSVRPLDDLIRKAISHLVSGADGDMVPIFGPEGLMSGARLTEPRITAERPPPAPLRQPTFSPYEMARARLMKRAREARSMTAPKLSAYVSRVLAGASEAASETLPLETIEQLRAYQVLQSVAMAMDSGSVRLAADSRRLAHGFEVHATGEEELQHAYLSGRPFVIQRRPRRTANNPNTSEQP